MLSRARAKLRYAYERAMECRDLAPSPLHGFWYFANARSRRRFAFRYGGAPFRARPIDRVALLEVAVDDEYGIVDRLLERSADPLVLDVGANIGLFALRVLALRPGARVLSLEPAGDTYAVLEENARLRGAAGWTTHRLAAWRGDEVVRFPVEGASTGRRLGGEGASESVAAVSLATLCGRLAAGRPVDLLKVDVEGAEEDFLVGAAALRRIGAAIVELHPGLCRAERVRVALGDAFPHVYALPRRGSTKPLLVATREPLEGAGLEAA